MFFAISSLLFPSTVALAGDSITFSYSESVAAPNTQENPDLSYILYSVKNVRNINGRQSTTYDPTGLCSSLQDENCRKNYWTAVSILPRCENEEEPFCITSLKREDKDAEFFAYTGTETFSADRDKRLARGSSISLWKTSENGLLAVAVKLSTSGDPHLPESSPDFQSMSLGIYDVELTKIPYSISYPYMATYSDGSNSFVFPTHAPECLTSYQGFCLKLVQRDKVRYQLGIRTENLNPTWMTGRLYDSEISLKSLGSSRQLLTISGQPSQVPEITATLSKELWAKAIGAPKSLDPQSLPDSLQIDNQNGRATFAYLEPIASLTTRALPYIWRVTAQFKALGPCFQNQNEITGYMMTNGMVHSALNPTILNGELIYSIASPHFGPDGSEIIGNYELHMRSDIARCLYKLSNAPVKATISVVDDKGAKKIATTTSGESNGWFHLSAKNFTFSSPTIKVKLTQEAKSITCVKGKTSKKITGKSPVCPKGFTKK